MFFWSWLRRAGAYLLSAQPAAGEPAHALSTWLFLRLLGVVYLTAFLSLWPQLPGLLGARGVLPAAPFLDAVRSHYGPTRYLVLPTLSWLGAGDTALLLLCGAGIVVSLLLVWGRAQLLALLAAWLCYLSLVSVGRDFMSFQWDALLLETSIVSLGVVPWTLWRGGAQKVVRGARWLLFWLLFRFMFCAGWAKLASGDPAWRDLTALEYHFETQPLPTWLGYYAHQLPGWCKKLATLGMFVVELGVPLLILWPRRRPVAFALLVGLQVVIAATGNYGFFNLLTIVLCVPLLDDAALQKLLPRRLRPWLESRLLSPTGSPARARLVVGLLLVGLWLPLSLAQWLGQVAGQRAVPRPLAWALFQTSPVHLVNRYGLFATMTRERPEIVFEGSRDGVTWVPYDLPFKPGSLERAPRWSAPHQPRLDWQLWFAAMSSVSDEPWLQGLAIRLLQGSPEVRWLLAPGDAFHERPPKYLRATLYRYRFTSLPTKRRTGAYWRREQPQTYFAPVALPE